MLKREIQRTCEVGVIVGYRTVAIVNDIVVQGVGSVLAFIAFACGFLGCLGDIYAGQVKVADAEIVSEPSCEKSGDDYYKIGYPV